MKGSSRGVSSKGCLVGIHQSRVCRYLLRVGGEARGIGGVVRNEAREIGRARCFARMGWWRRRFKTKEGRWLGLKAIRFGKDNGMEVDTANNGEAEDTGEALSAAAAAAQSSCCCCPVTLLLLLSIHAAAAAAVQSRCCCCPITPLLLSSAAAAAVQSRCCCCPVTLLLLLLSPAAAAAAAKLPCKPYHSLPSPSLSPTLCSLGSTYVGINFSRKLCGVSIIRSGESMENALRACCKGVKIGKILIHREGDYGKQLIYEKLPRDIAQRHVMLLDPVLASGRSAIKAIELLLHRGVPEERIIFLNLISAPEGIHNVCRRFPQLKIVTSEIDSGINEEYRVVPGMGEFGDRYFGTEEGDAGKDDERDGDGDAFEAS
ncbi:unnamed protein product [Closterium sp. NIES-54]